MKQWLKKWWCISLLLISNQATQAQGYLSLVPDGSFEDTTESILWQNRNGTECLKTWYGLGSNPHWDCNQWWYCNEKRTQQIFGLPGYFFNKFARNGFGAVYLDNYQNYNTVPCPCPSTNRGIVKNNLKQKLIAGIEYCATLYVIADERASNIYYTNGLAMYFDNGDLDTVYTIHHDSSGVYTHVQPQVQCPFVINDTLNWMKLQGTFVANGTESVLTIGNFLHDTAMQFLISPPSPILYDTFQYQGVLIDNVSLIPTDISGWLPDANTYGLIDSVWIGLDQFDYQDGKWFSINNQYITTGAGFWQKPIELGAKFIHEIDVCGVIKRDTLEVVNVPLGVNEEHVQNNALRIYPNPSTGMFTLSWHEIMNNMVTVEIFNYLGELVYTDEILFTNDRATLDLNLSKGIYVVKTSTLHSKKAVEKLIMK